MTAFSQNALNGPYHKAIEYNPRLNPRPGRANLKPVDNNYRGGVAISPESLNNADKVLPHNVEFEEGVLGALMLWNESYSEVAVLLKPEDFYAEWRAAIYQAIQFLAVDNKPFDAKSVRDELARNGLLKTGDNPDGLVKTPELLRIAGAGANPMQVGHYAKRLLALSIDRKIIGLAGEVAAIGFNQAVETGDKLSQIQESISSLMMRLQSNNPDYHKTTEDMVEFPEFLLEEGKTRAEREEERKKAILSGSAKFGPQLAYGLSTLDGDECLQIPPRVELDRGTLNGFIAPTSAGKTSFGSQIAIENWSRGAHVLYIHHELTFRDLMERRMTQLTGVQVSKHRNPERYTEPDMENMKEACTKMREWAKSGGTMDYFHAVGWKPSLVVERATALHETLKTKYGWGLDLIVVDYLQAVGMPENMIGQEHSYYGKYLLSLQQIANKLDVAVMCLSQMKRKQANSEDGEYATPGLQDALGSGDFERYCYRVFGITRNTKKIDAAGGTPAIINCLKNNRGPAFWEEELYYNGPRFTFEDLPYGDGSGGFPEGFRPF